jgi:hydrogenase maturation protein HypF
MVQGIGFRPFVYREALRLNITGSVRNLGGSAAIFAMGTPSAIEHFIKALENCSKKLPLAQISRITLSDAITTEAQSFAILQSGSADGACFISPDLPTCHQCEAELSSTHNRRNRHYFNTCTACGPRYSIIEALPYDRANTTMQEFEKCPLCQAEYTACEDRRFHAETVCCRSCGPELLFKNQEGLLRQEAAFDQALTLLKSNQILLIKGIGGYHLACSPFDREAVARLRRLKKRASKPFAVMFKDISEIKKHCVLSPAEEGLLTSSARPIVPLYLSGDEPFCSEVLSQSSTCGCFLPYTPLHRLLLEKTDALILTSANINGSPIIFEDEAALEFYHNNRQSISGVLYNNRKILRALEDSVARIINGKPQMLRRSRGYAPLPAAKIEGEAVALGGDLKASFCVATGGHAYMSQYFGDLINCTAYEGFKREIKSFTGLFNAQPTLAICDSHPDYISGNYAKTLKLPLLTVQHHHAHIASVMAEHGLKRVIGAAFDGTGYGEDGAVWGGEFLICELNSAKRAAHLAYTPLVGGDEAARDAAQTAACFLINENLPSAHIHADILKAAIQNGLAYPSSSMGRLFDAVAALLGAAYYNSYEGECAVRLEQLAEGALKACVLPLEMDFDIIENTESLVISHSKIIQLASTAKDKGSFALGFHMAVARMVAKVCVQIARREGIYQIALSGGVFQNKLLTEVCAGLLKEQNLEVYLNEKVPPNDGGIALGQAFIYSQGVNKACV